MYCAKHPSYTGYRAPKNKCFSCWKLYATSRGIAVAELSSKMKNISEARAEWLEDNLEAINGADLIQEQAEASKKTATATFITPAELVKEDDVKKEGEVKPVRGIKI